MGSAARRWRCLAGVMVAASLCACGEQATESADPATSDPGPIHVHGLGINPADDSLFVATHTGLFRAGPDEQRARRVGDRYQDTMGFTIVAPNHFLGSGHPDGRDQLPPFLGLIESRDAGRTWRPLSLEGEVDLHVLEASGKRVYGYGSDFESREPRFLTSIDGGRNWLRLQAPEPILSLAISPEDPRTSVASGERSLFRSVDGGRSWSLIDAPGVGLLAWTRAGLVLVDLDGRVWRSIDREGSQWRPVGEVGGQPAAFDAGPTEALLVALHDGTVKQSTDQGRTWDIRSQP